MCSKCVSCQTPSIFQFCLKNCLGYPKWKKEGAFTTSLLKEKNWNIKFFFLCVSVQYILIILLIKWQNRTAGRVDICVYIVSIQRYIHWISYDDWWKNEKKIKAYWTCIALLYFLTSLNMARQGCKSKEVSLSMLFCWERESSGFITVSKSFITTPVLSLI